jgi:hypothetical protein
MDRESGAVDRPEEERAEGESRGSERGWSSSDEGGEESGEEFALMVSTLKRSRWGWRREGGTAGASSRWRNNHQVPTV